MNTLWRRRLHRCARASGWGAGITVIVLAVLVALAQLLLPMLARHPAWVASQLSERLQRPVSFASLDGRWTASGPEFVMHGVAVGAAAGEHGDVLNIPQAELKLDFGGWLLPSRHLLNLHVHDLQLDLLRDAQGWHVNGIGVAGGDNRQPLSLGPLSLDLWLEDLRVVVNDATIGKHYTLVVQTTAPEPPGPSDALRRNASTQRCQCGGAHRRPISVTTVGPVRSGRVSTLPSSSRLLDGIDMDGYTARSR